MAHSTVSRFNPFAELADMRSRFERLLGDPDATRTHPGLHHRRHAAVRARRYPRDSFDLVVGLNRWLLRIIAYATLARDDYPPFSLRR